MHSAIYVYVYGHINTHTYNVYIYVCIYICRHKEVVVKGLTQLSKTPETICQSFFCLFAEGFLPNIMVRNRGGANVGTADMYQAVREMNEVYSCIERERDRVLVFMK